MSGITKLMTAGGGGVNITPDASIASDVTVKLPTAGINNGTLVCSDSSGNVGIGAVPSAINRLEVSSAGATRLVVNNTANSVTGRLQTESAAFLIQTDTNHPIKFAINNGAEIGRWDTSGNLLVGTSNALGLVTSAKTTGYCFATNSVGNGAEHILFTNSGTTTGSITRVGSTQVAYNTSSDYRLKENIQPMQNALATVQQLNPVTYTWKADGSDGQGFIAHELQAVVPDCVTGEKDAVDEEGKPVYQGIDTSFLVATLTKAIQELKTELDATKAEVAALKGAA